MSHSRNRDTRLPIPNGWFAVGWSRDLCEGDVRAVHYFGEDLVLFRTRSGAAKLLDAYCPHLGAHIGEGGRVHDESVRCPFHGWRFDGDGNCVAIPYCERIPKQARLRAWPVTERNGMVLAWHHAEGKPPTWDPPAIPEFADPAWTPARHHEFEVPAPVQDLDENNCDPIHFQFVHGMLAVPESHVEFGDGGRILRIASSSEVETPAGPITNHLEREAFGLGFTTVRMRSVPDAQLLMLSSTTPVEGGRSHIRWAITLTRKFADLVGEEYMHGVVQGVKSDLPIWRHKIHRAEPVLCEGDTTLAAFRRWAKQFYSAPPQPES